LRHLFIYLVSLPKDRRYFESLFISHNELSLLHQLWILNVNRKMI